MSTHSPAARAYADQYTNPGFWAGAAAAFDAGFARHLDAPEPEQIAYNDPRIRNGGTYQWASGPFVIDGVRVFVNAVRETARDGDAGNLLLLSEAPNPDAAVLERMMKADAFREEMSVYVSRLEFMRNAGLKVEVAS